MGKLALKNIDKLLLLTLFTFSLGALAQVYTGHKNPGCLPNSKCSPQTGLNHLLWQQALKSKSLKKMNAVIKKGFYPFDTFITKHVQEKTILWDSVCYNHKKKNISMGKLQVKNAKIFNNFNQYDQTKPFFLTDQVTRFDGKNFITYITPKEESPTSIRNNSIILSLGELGSVYHLAISKNRKLHIVPSAKEYKSTYSAHCSGILKNYKTNVPKDFPIRPSTYCRTIWNENTKNYEMILIETFCH